MRFAFASSSEVTSPIAQALMSAPGFVGFISNPDKPTGRNQIISPNGFSKWAQNLGKEPFKPISNQELETYIIENKIDLIITCAYGKLISKELLDKTTFGWLNIHFSVLPKYRGAAPVQRAIMSGETKAGYTIFKMDEGLDTGPILSIEELEISNISRASEVLDKLAKLSATNIIKLLESPKDWKFTEQDESKATLAPKISKEENKVSFNENSNVIINKANGLDINGGIWAQFRGEKHSFFGVTASTANIEPGVTQANNNELLIGCADGAISVSEIQPAGKKKMPIASWLNGARLKSGEKFE